MLGVGTVCASELGDTGLTEPMQLLLTLNCDLRKSTRKITEGHISKVIYPVFGETDARRSLFWRARYNFENAEETREYIGAL